jgi:putative ABC transport system permease protein
LRFAVYFWIWGFILTASAVIVIAAPLSPPAEQDVPSILVSRQLLTAEQLHVGDIVELSANADGANGRTFRIAGVYEPMANPSLLGARRLEARLHLPDLLSLTAPPADPHALDTVEAINVRLKDAAGAPAFEADLAARIPGLGTEAARGAITPFVVLERFHLAIALVTVIASSVFLLALMVMLVDERREIVGMLRLIGFKRRRLLLQVLAEGLMIAASGALFGILFALVLQDAVNRFFQWKYDTILVFVRITPVVMWQSIVIAVPLGVAASLLASWTLLRKQAYVLARR